MGCYKCGDQLDCVINDVGMGLTDAEQQEIVRLLFIDENFCNSDDKTDANQANCDVDTMGRLEFAFKSNDPDSCCLPQPIFGDDNRCPITGKYGLSNFAAYTIDVTPSSACEGCDPSVFHAIQHYGKCEENQGCDCQENCEDFCGNDVGQQCINAVVADPGDTASAETCTEQVALPPAIVEPVVQPEVVEVPPPEQPTFPAETADSGTTVEGEEPAPIVAAGACPAAMTSVDTAKTFDVSCYKCSTDLDCIIDDRVAGPDGVTVSSLTPAEKMELVNVLKANFCMEHDNGNMITYSGQQGCDLANYGFASDGCIPFPALGDNTVCPISGKNGLSNHATYKVSTVLSGAMACCPPSTFSFVSQTPKCDKKMCSCAFCDALGGCGHASPHEGYIPEIEPMTTDMRLTCPSTTTTDEAEPAATEPLPGLEPLSEPVCDESMYMDKTATSLCPLADPIVKVLKAKDGDAGLNPVDFIYDITFIDATDTTPQMVSFKVDNPLDNPADLYVAYSTQSPILLSDPACAASPAQAGCEPATTTITAVCQDQGGVKPSTLINVYIASNDSFLAEIGQAAEVKECCEPPTYDTSYGIIEYAIEIQCECPSWTATRKRSFLRH
jgi:hypothetical protein